MSTNHLITGSGSLLDEEGRLREAGYALQPPFEYSHERIAAHPMRIKDWDYYLVQDAEYAVALTFSDLGYIGLVSASVMHFPTRTFKTTSELVLMPLGSMGLPTSSNEGDVVWSNKRCRVSFAHVPGGRRLSFFMARFDKDQDLDVELYLDQVPQDSMVICTPWPNNPKAFYYNQKILGMRARGGFRRGAEFHEFCADEALGLLDWGRGVWTYDNVWYWAAAQGHVDGHVVALNLGYGFGDTTAASENMAFVDGVAHKLGRVDFGIPCSDGEGYAYLDPWHVTDDEGRLDLRFDPTIDRVDTINVVGVVQSDQHQVFGALTGTIVLDDGTALHVEGLPASAEHIHNRY
ncbi:MAG: DUF2804 domain-containing protein [Coriobacteriales bacterium]|nr:DUF2804 domain-containing protein [Coriobacteriales bacterium]